MPHISSPLHLAMTSSKDARRQSTSYIDPYSDADVYYRDDIAFKREFRDKHRALSTVSPNPAMFLITDCT